ncbi:MAG: hypothetical protein AABY61_10880 [Nitrospirota bacterium]
MMTTIRDLGWWYWFMTMGLLGASFLGWMAGLYVAMVLCAVQLAHVFRITRDATSFPMQVRAAYLGLLFAGLWGPLQWIHCVQLVGTSARVVIGYCFLARVLSLAPWNRQQPLSWDLITRTFFSGQTVMPSCGAVFQQLWLERVHR